MSKPPQLSSAFLESARFAPERDLHERIRNRFQIDSAYASVPDEVRAASNDALSNLRASLARVTRRMAPDLHRVVDEACDRLELPREFELLIDPNESINAGAYGVPHGTTTRVISLTAGAIKQLSPLHLRCVIGHELGHVAYGHTILLEQVEAIYQETAKPDLLDSMLRIQGRLAELSADRAGLLAVDLDLEAAAEAELRVATGLGPEHVRLDLPAYLDEISRLQEFDIPEHLFRASHPLLPIRMRALQLFCDDEDRDAEILELARLMDFEAPSDESRAQRDLILAGGLVAAHMNGDEELSDVTRTHLEELVLPFTDDPEFMLSRVETLEAAVSLFNQSAAWINENLGPERYDVFRKLLEVVLHDGIVSEGERMFLMEAARDLSIPPAWVEDALEKHAADQARGTTPPRAFGLRTKSQDG
jgi:Zn-dependent protease with chaperone function